jgi:hypothetical protein
MSVRLRRSTAAEWAFVNPVLELGEVGSEMDTGNLRVGDGVSVFTALPTFSRRPRYHLFIDMRLGLDPGDHDFRPNVINGQLVNPYSVWVSQDIGFIYAGNPVVCTHYEGPCNTSAAVTLRSVSGVSGIDFSSIMVLSVGLGSYRGEIYIPPCFPDGAELNLRWG